MRYTDYSVCEGALLFGPSCIFTRFHKSSRTKGRRVDIYGQPCIIAMLQRRRGVALVSLGRGVEW